MVSGIVFSLVHALSIVNIWCLGRPFSMPTMLFTLVLAIAVTSISVNGWELRELAVTAFFNADRVPSQRALLFSICFGLTLVLAALPGAIVLVFYSADKVRRAGNPVRG